MANAIGAAVPVDTDGELVITDHLQEVIDVGAKPATDVGFTEDIFVARNAVTNEVFPCPAARTSFV